MQMLRLHFLQQGPDWVVSRRLNLRSVLDYQVCGNAEFLQSAGRAVDLSDLSPFFHSGSFDATCYSLFQFSPSIDTE